MTLLFKALAGDDLSNKGRRCSSSTPSRLFQRSTNDNTTNGGRNGGGIGQSHGHGTSFQGTVTRKDQIFQEYLDLLSQRTTASTSFPSSCEQLGNSLSSNIRRGSNASTTTTTRSSSSSTSFLSSSASLTESLVRSSTRGSTNYNSTTLLEDLEFLECLYDLDEYDEVQQQLEERSEPRAQAPAVASGRTRKVHYQI